MAPPMDSATHGRRPRELALVPVMARERRLLRRADAMSVSLGGGSPGLLAVGVALLGAGASPSSRSSFRLPPSPCLNRLRASRYGRSTESGQPHEGGGSLVGPSAGTA